MQPSLKDSKTTGWLGHKGCAIATERKGGEMSFFWREPFPRLPGPCLPYSASTNVNAFIKLSREIPKTKIVSKRSKPKSRVFLVKF